MLAANRNDSVNGRTVILTVSINTRKGFNHNGAPDGSRCAIKSVLLLINLDIIIVIHNGKPTSKVNIKCEAIENVYATNPNKFKMITVINKLIKIIE